MKQWTYARIDRVESGMVHCEFCNRALRSGRLIVVRDESGAESYAGPACARKHLGGITEATVDLSRLAMALVVQGDEDGEATLEKSPSKRKVKKTSTTLRIERDIVVQYLQLRAEHMEGFAGSSTQRLREYHSQLQSSAGIGSSERLYVERLMAKSKASNSIYSLANVEKCIGAAYWLRIAIESIKPSRREFLEKILRSLREHWRLTPKQIEAVNRWGEGVRRVVPTFPALDAAAFEGVTAPRFASSQKSES